MLARTFAAVALLISIGGASAEPAGSAIHMIVNVDVKPDDEAAGRALLTAYIREARKDPSVTAITLVQQSPSNHFIIEAALRDEAAYVRHVQSGYVVDFRNALQPHLGSPWDERLGREIGR